MRLMLAPKSQSGLPLYLVPIEPSPEVLEPLSPQKDHYQKSISSLLDSISVLYKPLKANNMSL